MHQIYASLFVRRIAPALLWILLAFPGISQLSVGTTGSLYVSAGTTLSVDSLVLTPSTALTLSNNSIVKVTVPASTVPGMSNLQRVYNFGTPINYSGILGIVYRDSELGPIIENLLKLVFKQTIGGLWTTASTSSVNTSNNLVTYSLSGVSLNSVTAASPGVALPILFSSVSALLDGSSVMVKWEASSDIGLTGFYVQSSVNGRDWTTTAVVNAAQSATKYSYRDLNLDFSTRYYRIAMIETSGATTYSSVAMVRKPVLPFSLQVLLTGGRNVISFMNGTPDGIELYDMNGRLMKRSTVAQTSYDLGAVTPGIYILRFKVGADIHIRKLLLD